MNNAAASETNCKLWNDRIKRGECAVCGNPSSDDFPCTRCWRLHRETANAAIAATRETAAQMVSFRVHKLAFPL
jgi:hypothetical protein